MIRALKANDFSISCSIVNDDGSMGTSKSVYYTIRNASDDVEVVALTIMHESATAGIYYETISIVTVGDYRVYFVCSTYPTGSEDIIIVDEGALALEASVQTIDGIVDTLTTNLAIVDDYVDELESRLTATRAGYIDNLSAGAVALNSTVAKETTLTDMKGTGWTTQTLKAIKDVVDLININSGVTAEDVWTYVTRNLTPPVVDVEDLPGINHDTGEADALRYVDGSNNGIGNAYILAYLKTDYLAGRTSNTYIKGAAKTLADGRWFAPIYVVSGTYILVFTKTSEFGPDTAEVTV